MNVPTWWEAILLAFASYRVWRLLAEDKILEGHRHAFLTAIERRRRGLGSKVAELLECPWCMGFWISGAAAAAWYVAVDELHGWDVAFGFLTTWFAISALVGFLAGLQALIDRHNG